MIKGRYFIYLVLCLLLFYISITYPSKLFYPFYFLKEKIYYPVFAMENDNDFDTSIDFDKTIINNLNNEIEELKKLNNITMSLATFNRINATIIERNREYWFNNITINKGSNDGINLDMAVIDTNGLIGRISSVSDNMSVVKLITTNDTKNKISAVINNKVYGIINGYDNKNNYLELIITELTEIKEGSVVETTGMGGVLPSGILIGKVHDVVKKDDITRVARVIPSGNINGEKYVSVLQRKEDRVNN